MPELFQIYETKADLLSSALAPCDAAISVKNDSVFLEPKTDRSILVEDLAYYLSKYMIDMYEPFLVRKLLRKNELTLPQNEQKHILEKTLNCLRPKNKQIRDSVFYHERRTLIEWELLDYFSITNRLSVKGMLRFRLQAYRAELYALISEISEEYQSEKAFLEFIELLRYFLSLTESTMPMIHVFLEEDETYRFLDSTLRDVTEECTAPFSEDLRRHYMNQDDLLLSILIQTAPKQIILHQSDRIKNVQLKESIRLVFQDAVFFCKECELCKKKEEEYAKSGKNS